MTKWRSVKDDPQPRTGRPVLLWLADECTTVKGLWGRGPDNPGGMWWIPEWDIYQTDSGMHDITHWQPLPEPPETAA